MEMNAPQKICTGFLILLVIFWFALFITHTDGGFYNYLYSFLFGLIPLFGGIVAIFRAHIWGGLKSSVGRAVLFIGIGIFLWGYGETIWSYYNFFLNVAAPYPSWADLGFAPSIFFYGLGISFLSAATGAKFAWRNPTARHFAILAPIFIAVLSYYVLVVVARGDVLVPPGETPLKAVLDIAYPLGDFIGLTLAVVLSSLSFKYLGGRYKTDIFALLLGLGVMFIADSVFSYTTTVNTYYNADFGDLLLTLGVFFLTFGVLGFSKVKSMSSSKPLPEKV
jgi:hypothetical protein